MCLTFLAVPRFEGAVVFLAGAAFLPARTFFGGLAAAALAATVFADLATSAFFSATFLAALAAGALTAVRVLAFVATLLAEADLTAAAFVEAVFAGRPFVTDFGAGALAGLF